VRERKPSSQIAVVSCIKKYFIKMLKNQNITMECVFIEFPLWTGYTLTFLKN